MAAPGELLAFTDDDCRLSKEYISQLMCYDASDGSELIFAAGETSNLPTARF